MVWTKERVGQIVGQEKIVIFAKGSKDAPRCGFSHRAIDVLKKVGKPFECVDALTDASIRPALIEFSEWPTLPQVFIGGVLLGGADIVIEEYESGELQARVAKVFGEPVKEDPERTPRVTISATAQAKIKGFVESAEDLLRLKVDVRGTERHFALELDTKSGPGDLCWKLPDGLRVVVARDQAGLFDQLEVDWAIGGGGEGFSVKELGVVPPLPLPLELSRDELAQLFKEPPTSGRLIVVDVREDDEWASGHPKVAVHLPMSRLQKEAESKGFTKDDTLIFICAKGMRSLSAATHFRKDRSFPKARSLSGGIRNYPGELA